MNEWSCGKEFGLSDLFLGLYSGGSILRQFQLELKRKNWLNSIIFITRSSMNEWPSGKEFGLSYLLLRFYIYHIRRLSADVFYRAPDF